MLIMDTAKHSCETAVKKKKRVPPAKRISWVLETALFVIVFAPLAIIPAGMVVPCGRSLGITLYHLLPRRRKIAVENIRASLPLLRKANPSLAGKSAEDIARQNFAHVGAFLLETVKIYFGLGGKIFEGVEFRGLEHYEEARRQGKGVFFITGHCGNWELMALAFGTRYTEVSVVARRQNNPYLNGFLEKMRRRHGNGLIYKDGAFRGIVARLRENGIVGILVDQAVIPSEGYLVDFLGRTAWALKTPAMMARRNGAPMIPIFIHREGKGHVVTLHPQVIPSEREGEAAVRADTERLSRLVENYVLEHPFEWLWTHRRWKRAGEPAE